MCKILTSRKLKLKFCYAFLCTPVDDPLCNPDEGDSDLYTPVGDPFGNPDEGTPDPDVNPKGDPNGKGGDMKKPGKKSP